MSDTEQDNLSQQDAGNRNTWAENAHDQRGAKQKAQWGSLKRKRAGIFARSGALACAALALLSGCGKSSTIPSDDQYAGDSGQTAQSQETQSQSQDASKERQDADQQSKKAAYKDGTYKVSGRYGPIKEDAIDVTLTVSDNLVQHVDIVGHAFTETSRQHQEAFAQAINGVVDGKPLSGLKVDVVAGASWTSDAFNKALQKIQEQAGQH